MKIWDFIKRVRLRNKRIQENTAAHLDEALLPKERRRTYWERYQNKLLPMELATRRFSTSMRSRNMETFARVSNIERLKRFGLPYWSTEKDLAKALGISLSQLWWLATFRRQDRVFHYVLFRIPKRSGGSRIIMAPKTWLRQAQRNLLPMLRALPVSEAAHGFRKGRSTATNAQPHVDQPVVIRIDLQDFFGSVTFPRVRGLFMSYGYGYEVATTLALLTTESPRQPLNIHGERVFTPVGPRTCPQGAPTSPDLCNAIALKMDNRLRGLARSMSLQYTRYADDLTFSGDLSTEQTSKLLGQVRAIIEDEGFAINRSKTRIMRRGGRQEVAGVCVNKTMGLSRKKRRVLRARIHQLKQNPNPTERASIQGSISYLRALNPQQADALQAYLDAP